MTGIETAVIGSIIGGGLGSALVSLVAGHFSQRMLAVFNSQLAFGAEVRRQAAGRKVEAVLKIAEAARASVEVVYTASGDGPARKAAHQAYWATVRETLVLLGSKELGEIRAFGNELTSALIARDRNDRGAPNWADILNKGEAARDELLEALRRELQIEESQSNRPRS